MYEVAHLGIVVTDCERSCEFYHGVLGCEIIGENQYENLRIIYLKSGNLVIELLQYLNREGSLSGKGAIDHLAFNVPDIEAAVTKLKENGVPLLFDIPRVVGNKKIMFFTGPDGERLEFVETI